MCCEFSLIHDKYHNIMLFELLYGKKFKLYSKIKELFDKIVDNCLNLCFLTVAKIK